MIPDRRAELLKKMGGDVQKMLNCGIEVRNGNEIVLSGETYAEYSAKNVIQAFGRGFDLNKACKLLSEDYFFKYINLKEMFKNESQIRRIKARIIGREGKAKEYIETISGSDLSIYGNSIGIIGRVGEVNIATAALQILLEGGTHKKAYRIMEALRRKLKEEE